MERWYAMVRVGFLTIHSRERDVGNVGGTEGDALQFENGGSGKSL